MNYGWLPPAPAIIGQNFLVYNSTCPCVTWECSMAVYDPPQPLWKRNLAGILDFLLAAWCLACCSINSFQTSAM